MDLYQRRLSEGDRDVSHMVEEKRCAALAADIVVTVETKCARFVTESMTTMMESCPADCGSLTMKSTLMVSHGADGIGRGWSSPIGGCW